VVYGIVIAEYVMYRIALEEYVVYRRALESVCGKQYSTRGVSGIQCILEEGAVYVYKRMYRARVWYVRGQSDVCRGVCERSVKCVSCV
jgi:hypothetical protein